MAAQPKYELGMEELTSPGTLRASFAEMVATALFVFIGVGAVIVLQAGGGIVGVAIAHGLAIAVLVASIGAISGGHINPAVSFAMVITGRISITRGVMYVIAQLVGAAIGMALLRGFLLDSVVTEVSGAGGHAVNREVLTNLGGVGVEAVLTFVLVWVIFATAVSSRGLGSMAAFAIGFAVLIDHFVGVPLTGASMNPARTFGPALINDRWDEHWVYWAGPLIGAAAAAITYYVLYLADEERAAPTTA